jgi:hypothetical protein
MMGGGSSHFFSNTQSVSGGFTSEKDENQICVRAVSSNLMKASNKDTNSFSFVFDSLIKYEISVDEFNELRLQPVEALTESQIKIMKAIRDSIPEVNNETIMQKVIPEESIIKYLEGSFNSVTGYVTKVEDVKHLSTYQNVFDSLRLDYTGTKFNPENGEVLGIIRFKTMESSKIIIPFSKEFGEDTQEDYPFTGNGFTSAENNEIIPEYKCVDYLKITDGSELYEMTKDGEEKLIAVYNELEDRFVKIKL